jgi:hypothetical protein
MLQRCLCFILIAFLLTADIHPVYKGAGLFEIAGITLIDQMEGIPMIKRLFILIQVLILGVLPIAGLMIKPSITYACDCGGPSSVKTEVQRQTVVFSGKVVNITNPNKGLIRSSADPIDITFEVYDAWKGEVGKKLIVHTAMSGASCGFDFTPNEEYLVYANGDKDRLQVGLCGRTKTLGSSSEDLQALGKGKAILPDEIGSYAPQDNTRLGYYPMVAGVLLFVVIIIIVIWLRKRAGKSY